MPWRPGPGAGVGDTDGPARTRPTAALAAPSPGSRRPQGGIRLSPLLALALLGVVGLGVGTLAGLFGVGGGILAVPALGLLLGLDQHVAEGTSLAMILPTVALGAWRYARRGSVRWGAAARLGGAALVVSFAAAHLALVLPGGPLRLLFSLFLLFIGWRTLPPRGPRPAAAPEQRPPGALAARQLGIGALVGLLAGLLGVGGGTIAVPGLILLCGFAPQEAQGTSLAALTLSAAAGAAGYATAGRVDWIGAAALFAGAAVTVPLGSAAAHRLPARQLRFAFAGLVGAVAILELGSALRLW